MTDHRRPPPAVIRARVLELRELARRELGALGLTGELRRKLREMIENDPDEIVRRIEKDRARRR